MSEHMKKFNECLVKAKKVVMLKGIHLPESDCEIFGCIEVEKKEIRYQITEGNFVNVDIPYIYNKKEEELIIL